MNDLPAEGRPGHDEAPHRSIAPAATDESDGAQLHELQMLLFGSEPGRELAQLRAEVTDPKLLAPRIARILPEAIARRGPNDHLLSDAMTPVVIESIKSSARRQPEKISEAIFPILGPAIRRAISQAFNNLTQTINQTLQHSFTLRGLKWRLEAMMTGKSFAEVVMYHSLLYRVEQVFLIHRETGLALAHAAAESVHTQDAELVSSMLTAIQDFIKDSFGAGQGEGVESLQLGDLTVIAEQGPRAVLACVVRGTVPGEFREGLQKTLEQIHSERSSQLEMFHGDTTTFLVCQPLLEAHLESRYHPFAEPGRMPKAAMAVGVIVLAGLLVGGFYFGRRQLRWNRFITRLNATPGIVVTSEESGIVNSRVTGLRDSLAPDPAVLVREAGVDPRRVQMHWEEFHSPYLAEERSKKLLQPPPGVTLTLRNGILTATGPMSQQWSTEARKLAPFIPGISKFQTDNSPELASLKRELERLTIRFVGNELALVPGQEETLHELSQKIAQLDKLALIDGRRITIRITGHTDSTGTREWNDELSLNRARQVETLIKNSIGNTEAVVYQTAGKADTEPASGEMGVNRRVALTVETGP